MNKIDCHFFIFKFIIFLCKTFLIYRYLYPIYFYFLHKKIGFLVKFEIAFMSLHVQVRNE